MSAKEAYIDGFAYDVMEEPFQNGVGINNHVLLENDGSGAGRSEKGLYTEPIYAGVLVRKQFQLNDSRARRAHIVLYMTTSISSNKAVPYYLVVNGTRIPGSTEAWEEPMWRWVEIPTSLLRKGVNDVIVGCDAPKGAGYDLLFAREDEYEVGGGKYTYDGNTAMIGADQIRPGKEVDVVELKKANNSHPSGTDIETGIQTIKSPGFFTNLKSSSNSFMYFHPSSEEIRMGLKPIKVGATSAKSLDDGKTWLNGELLGPNNNVNGEYTIRLSLERFKPEGILDSPPIDLWSGIEAFPTIKPVCRVGQIQMDVTAFLPEGTDVIWQMRMANTNDMLDESWGAWQTLGNGSAKSFKLGEKDLRYLQWRALLQTKDPLYSPIVKSVYIQRQLSYDTIPAETYYVVNAVNTIHHYSSFRNTYENVKNPELRMLRKRLNIDSLNMDAHGDFEKINRLRHLVSSLWFHADPFPDYPIWNANKILDRNERLGAGGMCIQFTIVFMQALQSIGYNARHINLFSHESTEVYVDEIGAWAHVDPESLFDSYEFNTNTGAPLNVLDQHKFFLKELGFSASNPVDWTNPEPWAWPSTKVERTPQPIKFSTFTGFVNNPNDPPPQHKLAGFIRFVPRSDFLSRATPRPLTQGGINWPWNGYINWYDSATPRRLEYALQTDRLADLYPTLNRVEYTATYGSTKGQIDIRMITATPNFETFEINIDDRGWQSSNDKYTWRLRPAALNNLKMRTRNSA
ncbi:MAG: hypothetical protein ABIN89_11375, partial [Chitinophagaceae bacterium]